MGRGPTKQYYQDMLEGYVKGTLTCLTGDYIKSHISTDFPLVLNIEPTNACNLTCYLCPRDKSKRAVGYMEFDFFKRLVDECRKYPRLRMLNFHKDGESLLHPDLFRMIRYAKDAAVADVLHINTNVVALADCSLEGFLQSGIDDVTLSIDAYKPETFKKIKGADCLRQVESTIEELMQLRRRLKLKKPFIRAKIMEYADTYGEIDAFRRRWDGIVDSVQVTGVHNWSGAIAQVAVTDELERPRDRFPCVLLWYMLAVNWDGRVSICNVDWDLSGVVGDARTQSLHEIWNSDALKAIRRNELSGRHDRVAVCRNCCVWGGGEDIREWLVSQKQFYETQLQPGTQASSVSCQKGGKQTACGNDDVVAIIQARLGSSRLPGKTLMDIAGKPLLQHVVERVGTCARIGKVVIATTDNSRDDAIVQLADRLGVAVYRGSEDDVLSRYYECARAFQAKIVVRVCADDPFLDPDLIDQQVAALLENDFDYVGDTLDPVYPEGAVAEVVTFSALTQAWQDACKPSEREHVTAFIWNNPKKFRVGSMRLHPDYGPKENLLKLRLTIDHNQDLEFARVVYKKLYTPGKIFTLRDVLGVVAKDPGLLKINSGIERYAGYKKSLQNETIDHR